MKNIFARDFTIKNLYITSTAIPQTVKFCIMSIDECKNVVIDNCHFKSPNPWGSQGIISVANTNYIVSFQDSTSFYLKNCIFEDIELGVYGGIFAKKQVLENIIIRRNAPYQGPDDGSGNLENLGAIAIMPFGDPFNPLDFKIYLINSEISDCTFTSADRGLGAPVLSFNSCPEVFIINSTITDNHLGNPESYGGAIVQYQRDFGGIRLNIINSIVYNEDENMDDIYFENPLLYPSEINIKNSLIGSIYCEDNTILNADESNIFNSDPLFCGTGDYPFALSSQSPCIDAGTLDLPEGVELPETDLAGNPRVVGNNIDMGAYEYQGDEEANQNEIPKVELSLLNIYPNPFTVNSPRKTKLKFELELKKSGDIKIAVYNLKGQLVKTVMQGFASKGKYLSKWNGKNENGNFIATGAYLAKVTLNDKILFVRRFIVIK